MKGFLKSSQFYAEEHFYKIVPLFYNQIVSDLRTSAHLSIFAYTDLMQINLIICQMQLTVFLISTTYVSCLLVLSFHLFTDVSSDSL